MKFSNLSQNPYFLFLPFLIVSVALVLVFQTTGTYGDEERYLDCAKNLLRGFYSPEAPDIFLPNGPGYPIILMPFLALKLPLFCIPIMNAIFFYLSIVLIYKILKQSVSFLLTIIISLFWACYINAYQNIPWILSETLAIFLISLIIISINKAFNTENSLGKKRYLYLSGFLIGYLILTKVIFGYVLLFMILGLGLLWIFNRKSINHKKGLFILLIAFAINSPYLIYTYHITGKMFYWSAKGGDNLFWMSTPFKKEYGDYEGFLKDPEISDFSANQLIANEDTFKSNYIKKYEEILKFPPSGLAQDSAYKKIAINNIKSHPYKFALNGFCNIGRILFDFPYSYTFQKPHYLLRLPFNGIILVFILIILIPTLINWRKIDYSLRFLIFFALFYFCGSILGCAETRMFTIIVPILLFWIAYVIERSMKIRIRF